MKCCELMHFLIVILSDICQQWPISWTLLDSYAEKMDADRMKRKDRARLPESKRRRLFLKEERSTSKGGNEAIEGLSYQSGLSFDSYRNFFHNYFSMDKFVYYLYHICFRNWTFCERRGYRKNSRSCAKALLFLLFKFEKLLRTQYCYFRSGNHWPE